MNHLAWMLPLPVAVPLLSSGLALMAYRRPHFQQLVALIALSITTVISIILAVAVQSGPIVLDIGSWAAPIGITLVADRLSMVMLVISQIVTLSVLVYSLAQNLADDGPHMPIAVYFPTFLVLSAGVSNAFLTGDLFNLYVGVEILLSASFVLIMLGGTRGRVRAGSVYVVVSLLSSAIFFAGLALTYSATGTVNMAQLAIRLSQIDPGVASLIQVVLLVAFGIKAAIFPLQAWLPDSYPTAPAPVTAVFAGLMTKVGIYAIIRLQTLLFPGDRLTTVLTVIGLATMLIGILGAIAQDDIKRLLSFTLVSHIGYMVWGLALVSQTGLGATIYYAAHHIVVQTSLFLIAGLIERRTGSTSLVHLSGLARSAPGIAVMFFIAAMNLAGIPPLTGFVGKLGLATASVEAGNAQSWSLLAGGLVTSFLTLYVVIKWWQQAFWQSEKDVPLMMAEPPTIPGFSPEKQASVLRKGQRVRNEFRLTAKKSQQAAALSLTEAEASSPDTSKLMSGTVGLLILFQIFLAVASGPIWEYVDKGAGELMDRWTYISAVLPEKGRGTGVSVEKSGGSVEINQRPNPHAPPLDTQESGTPGSSHHKGSVK